MNMDRIEGSFKQVKALIKQQWGRVINDQFLIMEGRRENMDGFNQKSYGIAREEAPKRLAEWQAMQKGK